MTCVSQPDRTLFVRATGERAVVLSGLPPEELTAWLVEHLDGHFVLETSPWVAAPDCRWPLTPRELSILHRIALGRSNQQIAEDMFLSINTIKSYIRSAYRKIEVTSRSQAVLWAVRRGLDVADEPGQSASVS